MVLASLIEYSTWIAKRPLIHGSDQYKDTNNDRNGSSEVSSPLDQTLKYTLPTWYRHSHVVHTVDFRDNLAHHPHLDSERAIGCMYKKDYETSFNQLLGIVPLPQERNRTDSVLWGYRNDDDQELPPKDSAGWVTAVIQALGTHDLLIEEEPNDWYIDERGVFQERGRENTAVRDTIYCGISTIVKRKSDN
ncbi:hypothetical protein FAUST_137 [Fusarium austroamericanum]|uniref:Uncharacterized protein n=1 Tax=Fusarium austroamericanum TaxID=282268 RepID=A0AAN6HKZ1_FUSAU|nr:hypothetical protein FAUST_137 [Fusarium austroamericanum]